MEKNQKNVAYVMAHDMSLGQQEVFLASCNKPLYVMNVMAHELSLNTAVLIVMGHPESRKKSHKLSIFRHE